MAPLPTHHVKHVNNWEVEMHISPALIEKLASRNVEIRDNARLAICVQFRKACEAKYSKKWRGDWIAWPELKITPLPATTPQQPSQTQQQHLISVPASAGGNPECRCDQPGRCPVHDA